MGSLEIVEALLFMTFIVMILWAQKAKPQKEIFNRYSFAARWWIGWPLGRQWLSHVAESDRMLFFTFRKRMRFAALVLIGGSAVIFFYRNMVLMENMRTVQRLEEQLKRKQ